MKPMRVYLRALQGDDYKVTINWRNDDEIWSLVEGPKYFVSPDYENKWIENAISDPKNIRLGICLKETDKLIGLAILEQIDWINRSASSGLLIGDKKSWGLGYATEAIFLLYSFAFMERNLHRITWEVLETNTKSQKVVEKMGGKKEGLFRDAVYKNGRYQNAYLYSTLKSEFLEVFNRYESE